MTCLQELCDRKPSGISKASVTDSEKFCQEYRKLLDEEGYTQRAEQYLFDGFSYMQRVKIDVIYQYIASQEDKIDIYKKVIGGKRYSDLENSNDSRKKFILLLQLLVDFLVDNRDEKVIISDIIKRLPGLSLTSKKTRLHNYEDEMNKRFFSHFKEIASSESINDLELELNEQDLENFQKLIVDAINDKKFDVNADLPQKVLTWVMCADEVNEASSDNVEDIDVTEKIEETDVTDLHNGNQQNSESKNSDIQDEIERLNKEISGLKKGNGTLDRKCQELFHAKLNVEKTLDEMINTLKVTEQKLEDKVTELLDEKSHSMELTQRIKELEEKMNRKQEEISARKESGAMIGADFEKKYNVFVNRLASKLQSEYSDFLDGREELEKNVKDDLAENLCAQLETVFDIIIECGVPLRGKRE